MAQDVAAIDQAPPRLPSIQAGAAVRALVPQDFESAWRIANAVTKAGMAPRGLDTAEKAMVAIMHGLEIGLTPMNALQSIAVVNGRPTIWGDGAIGLVRGSGQLEWIEETIVDKQDDIVAVCRVKRRGENHVIERTFSKKDAETAHLWNKRGRDGQETPWQTYPKRMLAMRARAFALRDGFADVLKGLGIKEEVEDIPTQPMRDITPPSPPSPPPAPAITAPQTPPHDPDTGEVWDDPPSPPPQQPPAAAVPAAPSATTAGPVRSGAAVGVGNAGYVDAGDIPPGLRRNPDNSVPENAPDFDGEDWLKQLDAAFSGCEDAATLHEKQQQYMTPHAKQATAQQRKRAGDILRDHAMRISGLTMLDAG